MAGDYFIAEILSRATRTSGGRPAVTAEPENGSRRAPYIKGIPEEVVETVAFRVAMFTAWREMTPLTGAELYTMAAEEPALYRKVGGYLGWRSYLNAAAVREITQGEG